MHTYFSLLFPKIRNLYAKQKSIAYSRRKICNQSTGIAETPGIALRDVHGYQRSKSFTPFIKINCNTVHFISRITSPILYDDTFYRAGRSFWYFHNSARVRLNDRISGIRKEIGYRSDVSKLRSYLGTDKAKRVQSDQAIPDCSAKRYYVLCTDELISGLIASRIINQIGRCRLL